jgi:hypothetical protein
MFFNGAFDPLMLSLWSLSTGATTFYRQNIVKAIVSLVLLCVGIYVLYDASVGIEAVLGSAFFEFGALFFITKFFFLVEDNEILIERLQKQLAEARRSPGKEFFFTLFFKSLSKKGMGMALSYYYNFIVPTAANLSADDENGGQTAISMEIGRGQFEPYTLTKSHLLGEISQNFLLTFFSLYSSYFGWI